MSTEARLLVLSVEVERLRQENDRLRTENAALRPLIATLRHENAQKCHHCEYHPHDVPITRRHEHG